MAIVPESAGAPLRIGVIGGTFDPVHIGHLIIAEEARCRLGLDRVIFVPARVSPLKQDGGTLFDEVQRLAMVTAAVAGNPAFEVSRIDLDRPAPSYTVDTLRLLREACGEGPSLHFIMGADSLIYLPQWHDPAGIVRLARLAVISRPGNRPDLERLEVAVPGIGGSVDLLEGLAIGISSTELRRRLAAGLSVRYQVPDAVLRLMASYGSCEPHPSATNAGVPAHA